MRLRKTMTAAQEELDALLNDGYRLLTQVRQDREAKRSSGQWQCERDTGQHRDLVNAWGAHVAAALDSIFPTEREKHYFLNAPSQFGAVSSEDYEWQCLVVRTKEIVQALDTILTERLSSYTDLPIQTRLYVEDIDSFRKVRDVNPAAVADVLRGGTYLDRSEEMVQLALEHILDVAFHKKDWGGEINDLYTANVVVNGARVATAFLLKGNGLRAPVLELAHCGKNGDQIVRLFESPADLFVVQFVGEVSEMVIKDAEGKVEQRRANGRQRHFCVMNGQDTARVLRAYGKL